MKLAIITAIWQREALTRIFLQSVRRYYREHGVMTFVSGSEGSKSRNVCLEAGAIYVESPNKPLSRKFNDATYIAEKTIKPDGFIIMGSDDFMNGTILQHYDILLQSGFDVVGFRDCYFYNGKLKEGGYWSGYSVKHRQGESIGMGRMLSRKAFKLLHGRPWSMGDAGLDWIMTQKLKKFKKLKRRILSVKDDNYMLVDVKGFGNKSGYGAYKLEPVDNKIFDLIPEFEQIKKL